MKRSLPSSADSLFRKLREPIRRRRIGAGALAAACLLASPGSFAQSDTFDFSLIRAEDGNPWLLDLNYFGQVFYYHFPAILNTPDYFLSDGESTHAFPVGYRDSRRFGVGLNDNGQIVRDVFSGGQVKEATILMEAYTDEIVTIATRAEYPELSGECFPADVNNAGQVACLFGNAQSSSLYFLEAGAAPRLIAQSGGPISPIQPIRINNLGQVAFPGFPDGAGNVNLYVWDDGVITPYVELASQGGSEPIVQLQLRWGLSLNDQGEVAVAAQTTDGSRNIYLADGESMTLLVDGEAFGDALDGVAMNNVGDVAFLVNDAIYTGADAVADRLVGVGDELLGRTVVELGAPLINDFGQIAFGVDLDTGDPFSIGNVNIARADPIPEFLDVPPEHWARAFVQALVRERITSGCGNEQYCPDDPVTRAQMAVFLERGIRGSDFYPPAATGSIFGDVGAGDFAAAFIEQLYLDGITNGCGPAAYCPGDSVTRAQMAVFLLRSKYGTGYRPPPATGAVFADVGAGYWSAAWIEQLAADGITGGCGGGNYCPDASVTRAQMAVFLVRTFGL